MNKMKEKGCVCKQKKKSMTVRSKGVIFLVSKQNVIKELKSISSMTQKCYSASRSDRFIIGEKVQGTSGQEVR